MSDEQALRERAVRRWRWRVFLPGAIGGLAGPLFGRVAFHHRQHESLLGSVIATSVGVLAVVLVLVLVARRRPQLLSGSGWFSAPLVMGLDRRQRRAARRAVQHVRPSSDLLLRAVEQDLADRSLTQRWPTTAILAGGAFLLVVLAGGEDLSPAGRICLGVVVVAAVGLAGWTWFFTGRARAYLALTGSD